jgi:hypothetical protein
MPYFFDWKPYEQSILIPQFGANTIKHFFGLLGRRLVIVGGNHHGGSDSSAS